MIFQQILNDYRKTPLSLILEPPTNPSIEYIDSLNLELRSEDVDHDLHYSQSFQTRLAVQNATAKPN